MRIVLFTSMLPAFAALGHLRKDGWLKAVVAADKVPVQNLQLKEMCDACDVRFVEVSKNNMLPVLGQLFADIQPDVAIAFSFSYRIPFKIYNLPPLGFYNVHFSLLPAYRGPDPVFHQLKNGEQMSGVTIHKLDEQFDSGEIVMQQPLQLIPGETWGLCFSRHIPLAADMVTDLLRRLNGGLLLQVVAQDERKVSYHKRLDTNDTTINWDVQTAAEIDNLVNACNPSAGGALTFFNHMPVRVFEVSQVEGQSGQEVQPGTVIHAGPDGVYVQCLNRQMLRINILSLNEGVMSGAKMAAIGIRAGDVFCTNKIMQPVLAQQQ